jgi:hypothetical protein
MRLDNQLRRMLEHYNIVVLMVHGWFGLTPNGYLLTETGRPTGRQWNGLWNALAKWQLRGVMVQLAVDRRHVAQRLVSLRNYLRRKEV